VRGVHDCLGDFAFQAREADVQPCSEEVNVARIAKVDFGIDGCVSRSFTCILLATTPLKAPAFVDVWTRHENLLHLNRASQLAQTQERHQSIGTTD